MNNQLLQAASDYLMITQLHETTNGESCYIAYHPELPNCIGQGVTPKEAEADLMEATVLTLEYLCDTGQPIPHAQWLQSSTPIAPPEAQDTFGYSRAYPSWSEKHIAPSVSML